MTDIPTQSQPAADTPSAVRFFQALVLVVVMAAIGWFVYNNATNPDSTKPFKLGLDLAGGSQLIYEADVTDANPMEVPELMSVLRTVIENRVNSLGTEENAVYLEQSSFVTDEPQQRLVVELPGVTDVAEAVAKIGETPELEFKLFDPQAAQANQVVLQNLQTSSSTEVTLTEEEFTAALAELPDPYTDTGLTGRYLESAALEFTGGQGGQIANQPVISIRFNDEGKKLFETITSENVGGFLAIFLDGEEMSSPRINEPIRGGTAIISGSFTRAEALELAQNLNFGALPIPIELVGTQTVGATLGAEVLERGMVAGAIGFGIVTLFLVGWYRLAGVVAAVAIVMYVLLMLALFQQLPVTLTAAGLAGFVLSLGIAVDANVLVFERFKEEYRAGKSSRQAIRDGFARAWNAIRDGNVTSILSAVLLFWFGTSLVKGFALVFGFGVIISMFTAVVGTRTLLLALPDVRQSDNTWLAWLFGNGISRK